MSGDLSVLLTIWDGEWIHKVAVYIPNGLGTFENYKYFGLPEINEKWNSYLPDFARGKVVALEEIFYIGKEPIRGSK